MRMRVSFVGVPTSQQGLIRAAADLADAFGVDLNVSPVEVGFFVPDVQGPGDVQGSEQDEHDEPYDGNGGVGYPAATEEGLRGAMTVGFAAKHLPQHALVVQLQHAASVSAAKMPGRREGDTDNFFLRVDGMLVPLSSVTLVPSSEEAVVDPPDSEEAVVADTPLGAELVTLKLSKDDSRIVVKALLRDAHPRSVLPRIDRRAAHAVAREVRKQLGTLSRRSRLRELLAAHAHEQWSQWMRYLFTHARPGAVMPEEFPDASRAYVRSLRGGIIIPAASYKRWLRQERTAYADLSDNEKESDRREADKYIELLEDFGVELDDGRGLHAVLNLISEELYGARDDWEYPGQIIRSVRALMVLAKRAVEHTEHAGRCMFCHPGAPWAGVHGLGCPLKNLPVTIQDDTEVGQ